MNATEKFYFSHTCTIDYFLFAMWLSTKLSPQVLTILNQKQSTEMILN
jgi:hypothetical protein